MSLRDPQDKAKRSLRRLLIHAERSGDVKPESLNREEATILAALDLRARDAEVRRDTIEKAKAALVRDSTYHVTTITGEYRTIDIGKAIRALDALLHEEETT
jgi:predicted Holliday junction resolvase-like endonuclease